MGVIFEGSRQDELQEVCKRINADVRARFFHLGSAELRKICDRINAEIRRPGFRLHRLSFAVEREALYDRVFSEVRTEHRRARAAEVAEWRARDAATTTTKPVIARRRFQRPVLVWTNPSVPRRRLRMPDHGGPDEAA